jgi:hypothetical protein
MAEVEWQGGRDALFALMRGTRHTVEELVSEWQRVSTKLQARRTPGGYQTLARSMRPARPGTVFALAAAANEIDPLNEIDSRLFVGLKAG